jgi:hypothetical protein
VHPWLKSAKPSRGRQLHVEDLAAQLRRRAAVKLALHSSSDRARRGRSVVDMLMKSSPSEGASHSAALRGDKIHLLVGALAVERLVQSCGFAGGVDSNRCKTVDNGQHDVRKAEGPHG